MKIEAQITSIISDPMQQQADNAATSYQYPCFVAINKSYFIDISEVEDAKKRLAGLKSQVNLIDLR